MDGSLRNGAQRPAFTVLELLVSVSIIGVLAALLLPAIGSVREASRRMRCSEHLREIGLAMHHHHLDRSHLPAGWTFDPSGTSAYGWAVPLLPYLEQAALADQIKTTWPLNHPRHERARSTSLETLLCPSDIAKPTFTLYEDPHPGDSDALLNAVSRAPAVPLCTLPTANYVGMFGTIEADDSIPAPLGDGAFLENRVVRFRDFSRGLSQTLLVGERTMAQVPSTWLGIRLAGEDAAARLVGSALEGINHPLADEADHSSRHPGGANFLWGDGHVSFVAEAVELRAYHDWARLRHASFE